MKKSAAWQRFFPLTLALFCTLLGCTLLRLFLVLRFASQEALPLQDWVLTFLVGLRFDLAVAAWLLLLPLVWFCFLPDRIFHSRRHQRAVALVFAGFIAALLFFLIAEYYFFAEFSARFNAVAVYYLRFKSAALKNLGERFPVGKVMIVCGAVAAIAYEAALYIFKNVGMVSLSPREKKRVAGTAVALFLLTQTLPRGAHVSKNPLITEISRNGAYAFVQSALSRNTDDPLIYSLDRSEVFNGDR